MPGTDGCIRLLLFADTHLGIDKPQKPRINRRRRGDDFERNLLRIINTAKTLKIDLAVHGGDIFYRSRIPPELTSSVFDLLSQFPQAGIPLYVIPGNHERSKIPHPLLAVRPGIHVFHQPQTRVFTKNSISLSISGFPFHRSIRKVFQSLYLQTNIDSVTSDFKLLCFHQAVQGATVGVHNYTFRQGDDVIPHASLDLPVDAILSGHIHRAQILTVRRKQQPDLPVIYPGSIERTAFAERNEPKGFFIIECRMNADGHKTIHTTFRELPARPMIQLHLDIRDMNREQIRRLIVQKIAEYPPDAIVAIGFHKEPDQPVISTADIRKLSPPTMNISVRFNLHGQSDDRP